MSGPVSLSESRDRSWLLSILVCPRCRGGLLVLPDKLHCSSCAAEFIQPSDTWVNLYTEEPADKDTVAWEDRQHEMEGWYTDLISDRERAVGCFQSDYSPFASSLRSLAGRVLDLGGGIGFTRHFLATATHYVVLEPSLDWLSADWSMLSEEYPCLSSFPNFVHGVGEQLPFRSTSFDAVVALWSLNHVRDPAAVLSEVSRVLAPGGRFLVVLEDMIPSWRDVLLPSRQLRWPHSFTRKAWRAVRRKQWPLQSDHLRILERDIAAWIDGRLEVKRREWIGHYLTFELARPENHEER
jgi:SAM-dependent methyltransferase